MVERECACMREKDCLSQWRRSIGDAGGAYHQEISGLAKISGFCPFLCTFPPLDRRPRGTRHSSLPLSLSPSLPLLLLRATSIAGSSSTDIDHCPFPDTDTKCTLVIVQQRPKSTAAAAAAAVCALLMLDPCYTWCLRSCGCDGVVG